MRDPAKNPEAVVVELSFLLPLGAKGAEALLLAQKLTKEMTELVEARLGVLAIHEVRFS